MPQKGLRCPESNAAPSLTAPTVLGGRGRSHRLGHRRGQSRDLLRLVYVSAAARPLGADDLEAIAKVSERNNAARGLTGLLLFGGARFYGVLEGPRRRVLSRMEAIITDPRHRDLRIIIEDDITAQRFANWSFGRIPASDGAADPAESLETFILGLAGRL